MIGAEGRGGAPLRIIGYIVGGYCEGFPARGEAVRRIAIALLASANVYMLSESTRQALKSPMMMLLLRKLKRREKFDVKSERQLEIWRMYI